MSKFFNLCICLLIALLLIPTTSYAQSQLQCSDLMGGSGGRNFSDDPRSSFKVARIIIRAGVYIDSIQVIYRTPDGKITKQQHGGNGGSEFTFFLNTDEHITEISGRHGRYIDAIRFHTNYRVSPVYGGPGGLNFSLKAPVNHYIIGFRGRSGLYIDAIGIICEPK